MWPALPSSEYYELIRLPAYLRTFSFVVDMSYHQILFRWSCRVIPSSCASLFIHATPYYPDGISTPRQYGASLLTSMPLKMSSSALRNDGAQWTSGVTVLPVACIIPCLHFMQFVRYLHPVIGSVLICLPFHYDSVAPS